MRLADAALPAAMHRGVERGGVVHGGQGAVSDVVAHAHVVEHEVRDGGPAVGERVATGEEGAEEVVLVVPVAEVASEGEVEHPPELAGRKVLRGANVVRAVVREHPVHRLLQPPAAAVRPEVALVVDQGVEGRAVLVGKGHVGRTHQGRNGADTTSGQGITRVLEIVEHHAAHLGREGLDLEVVRLVQVDPHELGLRQAEGRQVVQVHAAHLQFRRGGQVALVELAIARSVAVLHTLARDDVDRVVGPGAVHIGVVGVRRPGPLVFVVPVGGDVAAVRHGDVAEDVNRLHLGGVGVIGGLNDAPDAGGRGRSAHIGAEHGPSIGLQVLFQGGELGAEGRAVRVVHQQDELAPVFGGRHFDAGGDVTLTGPGVRRAHHPVLVIGADGHRVVLVRGGRCGGGGDGATPSGGTLGLPVDGDAGGVGEGRPAQGDAGRRRLHGGLQLDRAGLGGRLGVRANRDQQGRSGGEDVAEHGRGAGLEGSPVSGPLRSANRNPYGSWRGGEPGGPSTGGPCIGSCLPRVTRMDLPLVETIDRRKACGDEPRHGTDRR
ncbi:MAG: hypothetical protein GFGODING_02065 [Flavobacteriales bacterium]|nr:hypothetical protein [Flavobacteriales bacterium]